MKTTKSKRDEMRALEAKATPANWVDDWISEDGDDYRGYVISAEKTIFRPGVNNEDAFDDAKFIAAARNALPDLLDQLDEADELYEIARQMANCVYNANQDPALWERAKRNLVELLAQFDAHRRGRGR